MPKTEQSNALAEMGSEDIIQQWKAVCGAISEIASKLAGDPPQPEYLKDLQLQTAALERLQGSLTSAMERGGHESLLRDFAQMVASIAADSAQSPIGQCTEQIDAQWRLVLSVRWRPERRIAPGGRCTRRTRVNRST